MDEILRDGASIVAPKLLGCRLCIRRGPFVESHRITEVEAYEGYDDKASHAHRGQTARNAVMFGPYGFWYVYLCYGIHWMLNLVTGETGYPSAVLIRGLEGVSGPGRLSKRLGVDRRFNGEACQVDSGLWIDWMAGKGEMAAGIMSSPRIGVDYAGEEWSAKPWRWYLEPAPRDG